MICRIGSGRISAAGGNGFAGGGGGRVSVKVISRHDNTQFFIHGKTKIFVLNYNLIVNIASHKDYRFLVNSNLLYCMQGEGV